MNIRLHSQEEEAYSEIGLQEVAANNETAELPVENLEDEFKEMETLAECFEELDEAFVTFSDEVASTFDSNSPDDFGDSSDPTHDEIVKYHEEIKTSFTGSMSAYRYKLPDIKDKLTTIKGDLEKIQIDKSLDASQAEMAASFIEDDFRALMREIESEIVSKQSTRQEAIASETMEYEDEIITRKSRATASLEELVTDINDTTLYKYGQSVETIVADIRDADVILKDKEEDVLEKINALRSRFNEIFHVVIKRP